MINRPWFRPASLILLSTWSIFFGWVVGGHAGSFNSEWHDYLLLLCLHQICIFYLVHTSQSGSLIGQNACWSWHPWSEVIPVCLKWTSGPCENRVRPRSKLPLFPFGGDFYLTWGSVGTAAWTWTWQFNINNRFPKKEQDTQLLVDLCEVPLSIVW